MREILFRGKSADGGKWYEGFFCGRNSDGPFGPMIDEPNIIKYDTGFWVKVDPETVGQYTGLKDKNGKQIFEGDVLKVWCEENPEEYYFTKVWAQGTTLCVDVMGEDYDYTAVAFADDIWNDASQMVEIIGNIHDNPELLKGGGEE